MNAAGLVRPIDVSALQVHEPATHPGDAPGTVEKCLAVPQGVLGPLALGDVHAGAGHPARASVVAAREQLAPVEHPDPAAVLVLRAALVLVVRQTAIEVLLQQHRRARAVVWMGFVGPRLDRRCAEFVESVAGDFGPSLVEHGLARLDVPFPGADVRALEDVPESLTLASELAFGLLAIVDVLHRSGHARGAPGGIERDLGSRPKPPVFSAPGAQKELQIVGFATRQCLSNGVFAPGQMAGVEQGLETAEAGDQIGRLIAQQRVEDRRPPLRIAIHVHPVPQAVASTFDGERQPVSHRGELLLRRLAVGDVGTDRDVFFDHSVRPPEGRDHAVDPIQRAVFGSIADLATPGGSAGNRSPHLGPESVRLNVGVDDPVVLPEQLLLRVAADVAERLIHFDDPARPVRHGDDGVLVNRAQQGVALPNGCLELQLDALLCSDLGSNFHEPGQYAVFVTRRLNLGVDPIFVAILCTVQYLDTTCLTGDHTIEQDLDGRGVGFAAAEELARRATHGFFKRVPGDPGETFIDPVDAHLRVGNGDRIRRVLDDAGKTRQVGRHALCTSLRANAAHRQQPHSQRHQKARCNTADRDESDSGTVDRGFKGRRAGCPKCKCPTSDDEAAQRMQFVVGGSQTAVLCACERAGPAIEDETVRLCRLAVEQLDVERAFGNLGHTAHDLGDHDGGVEQADQIGLALLNRSVGGDTRAVDRGEQSESCTLVDILRQRDAPAEDGHATANGTLHRLTLCRVAPDIHAERGSIHGHRLDVLDQVQVLSSPGWVDREIRTSLGPL